MQSRQPPSRLPPQESDISRFGNPLSEQPLHFTAPVLQHGLTHPTVSVEQPWRWRRVECEPVFTLTPGSPAAQTGEVGSTVGGGGQSYHFPFSLSPPAGGRGLG